MRNRLTILLFVAGAVVAFGLLGAMIIDMSGLMPGDNGAEATASTAETDQDSTTSPQTMDLAALPWVGFVLVSTVILGFGIAYAQRKSSQVTPSEEARTEAAVRELHRRENDPEFRD